MTSLLIARTAFSAPFALIALAPLVLVAAETTPADALPSSDIRVTNSPAPAAPQSYAAAFEKLFAFGLPDTREAVFVKCSGIKDPFIHNDDFAPGLFGFGWRMPDSGKGKSAQKILVGGVALFERASATTGGDDFSPYSLCSEPALYAGHFPLPKSMVFRDAVLSAELDRAHTRLLVWKAGRARMADDPRYAGRSQQPVRAERLAPYLILAAHGWRCGHAEEANRLAASTLSCTDKPDAVAKAALSSIADARWGAALSEWRRTPGSDPAGLAKELDALITRFAQGWRNTPAARHLLGQLRCAKEPAAPTLENHSFSPAQLQFARDLLALRELPANTDWLAPAKPGDRPSPVTAFLREQGVEALPVLAALAEDASTTVCVGIRPTSRNDSIFPRSDNDRHRSDAEAFREWMSRPLSRAEIVARLVQMTKGCCLDITRSRSLRESLLADYSTLKREGRVGLLLEKLAISSGMNSREIRANLLDAGLASDADAARVEESLRDCDNKGDILRDHLAEYLAQRRSKAADFFAKFAAAARADIESRDDADFTEERRNRMRRTGRHEQQTPTTKAGMLAELDSAIARIRPLVETKD